MTENSRIEFKSKLTDDLEKEVVAFLNAEGGVVYIGRNETKIYKLNNIDELQLKIKDRLKHNISPSILGETYHEFCVCDIITNIFHSSTPCSNFITNI